MAETKSTTTKVAPAKKPAARKPPAKKAPAKKAPAKKPASAYPTLDKAIAELKLGAEKWSATSLADRAKLMDATHDAISQSAKRWARTAIDIKRLDPDSPLRGEEWLSGPYATLQGFAAASETLKKLAQGKSPLDGIEFKEAPRGRLAVPVLPHTAAEGLLLNGFSGEVWMPPGTSDQLIRRQAGLGQLTPTESGGVGLVLGAGNITSIAPLDVLYELLAFNRVSILKLNPIMSQMMSVYLNALAPLIQAGFLRIVQGGAAEGEYLTQHPGIDHVHITGSAATHDAIVWGTGADATKNRKAGKPKLNKPITSELGGVSPIIIVPGSWSKADLKYQAEHVVTMRMHNSGHNCIAGQVVLLSKSWPQRTAFLAELRKALAAAHERPTWYPGGDDRVDSAASAYPKAQRISSPQQDRLLVTLGADDDASALCSTEYFAPVLGVVELPGSSAEAFLEHAVDYANDKLVGTLGANMIIAPAELKALGSAFDDFIVRLRYGTIAINAWTALGFLTPWATWGAYPGSTLEDVGSGIGVVHNAFLLYEPERTVVRGPFRDFPRSVAGGELALFPKPPWFVTRDSAGTTSERLTQFGQKPSLARMASVFASAFRK